MKKSRLPAFWLFVLLITIMCAGCKNNDKADPDPGAANTHSAVTDLSDGAGKTAPEAIPTVEEKPAPVLVDPDGAVWFDIASDEGIIAANQYNSFINGSEKVAALNDIGFISRGEYDINTLTANMASNLNDYVMPCILTEAFYAIIDCGADGFPELVLKLYFSENNEDPPTAVEFLVIGSADGKPVIVDHFEDYYRSYAQINRFGVIGFGGSSGADRGEYGVRFINARLESVTDYIYDYYMDIGGPVIPRYILPQEMEEALSSFYEEEEVPGFDCNIWSIKESEDDPDKSFDDFMTEYLTNAVIAFNNETGDYIMPDDAYVSACAELGIRICSDGEWDDVLKSHRESIGLTDEMAEADEPVWYPIKGAVEAFSFDPADRVDETGEELYKDFLGTWYLRRGETDGYDWDAEEDMAIQSVTFFSDRVVEIRVDYSEDEYGLNHGICSFERDYEGNFFIRVDYQETEASQEYYYSIVDGKLIENGTIVYEGDYNVSSYAEYERVPFWGEQIGYYEYIKPVVPDLILGYIDEAKENERLIMLTDPDDSLKHALDEGKWELHDESDNYWIDCKWENKGELVIVNSSDKKVELEIHEPKSGYDPSSSEDAWEKGPFFYWADLKPGELARFVADIPDDPRDASMCLYMKFEDEEDEYYIRIYRYPDKYISF